MTRRWKASREAAERHARETAGDGNGSVLVNLLLDGRGLAHHRLYATPIELETVSVMRLTLGVRSVVLLICIRVGRHFLLWESGRLM